MRLLPIVAAVAAAFVVVSCSSPTPPSGVTVVEHFDAKRYIGTWYEIARFDHRFERGLTNVTATYTLRDDGGLNVINKVSFFGPFYGGYNVIALDKDYQHALVFGPNRDSLWILSRTRTIPDKVKQQLLDTATRQGFAIEKLIWVPQNR